MAFSVMALAQTPAVMPPPVARSGFAAGGMVSPPTPPALPSDPLELVPRNAQLVESAEDRAAAITVLERARQLSNVRAQPYDLKTSFTSYGTSSSDGSWNLEDMSPERDVYRWTAQGPSYSATYLYRNKLLSADQPARALPLRLAQARDALFFIYPWTGRFTSLRTANASLAGAELRCVLVNQGFQDRQPPAGGRGWDEAEYCVDTRSGALTTYSPVPGLYVRYDYASALRFHDKLIPDGFTISEAGRNVIEARTETVRDPPDANASIFSPAELKPLGVGSVMKVVRARIPGDPVPMTSGASLDFVVLHGMISPQGRLEEIEILASSNSAFDQTALQRAQQWRGSTFFNHPSQPGTTPQSGEAILTVAFAGGGR
jgi:hypothetical protein